MNIKWIFFDVGSTLVDETKAYDHRARDMIEGTNITFSDFDGKRIELAKLGFDGNSKAIEYFALKKTPWHSEDETPFADAIEVLEYLKEHGYKLGVIANQNDGLTQRLKTWGMFECFDVIVSSSELGLAKPDRRIFEKALEWAGCQPENAVMAGDRLDNDIFPAKAIGMKTLWVKQGTAKYQSADLANGTADWVVDNLTDLKELFKKRQENNYDYRLL
ncbi:MAG: HAD family hydrolase [Clostridia bacterium]|nr:HAD family hydrolase [Clostridia bacterium]